MAQKSTLTSCVEREIQPEIDDNTRGSTLLFKVRAEFLESYYHLNKLWQVDTQCDLYGERTEDLKHVLLWCPALVDAWTLLPDLPISYLLGFEGDHSIADLTKRFVIDWWEKKTAGDAAWGGSP